MLTLIRNLFTKARAAFVRARGRVVQWYWIRRIVKGGKTPVVEYAEIEHAALTQFEEGKAIDDAFFAQPDDEAEFNSELDYYRRQRSTIELRWECENKFGADFTRFAQRADEQPLDYRARLLKALDS